LHGGFAAPYLYEDDIAMTVQLYGCSKLTLFSSVMVVTDVTASHLNSSGSSNDEHGCIIYREKPKVMSLVARGTFSINLCIAGSQDRNCRFFVR